MKFHPVTSFNTSLGSIHPLQCEKGIDSGQKNIRWIEKDGEQEIIISVLPVPFIGKQYLERQKITVEFMHLSLSGAEQQRSGSYVDINQKSLKSSKCNKAEL